ncbi:MAG: hypothetical protein LBQ49_00605 [Rickettsiales bacterium]|jgi:DnaK suppressor protein|nr:hypothetical protein [Rickettsiales bacterium]
MTVKKDYKTLSLPDKYIPKKTEKYMCLEHKAYFYQLLVAQKQELEREVVEIEEEPPLGHNISAAGAMDEGDAATLSIEADLRIKIQERDMAALRQVDAALERLEDGTYGYSLISGEEIGLKRLMVRPVATVTAEEKSENER